MLMVNTLMKALFVVEFLKDLFYDRFYFQFLSMIFPLHITSNKVNCDIFADDTSLSNLIKIQTLFKMNYREA